MAVPLDGIELCNQTAKSSLCAAGELGEAHADASGRRADYLGLRDYPTKVTSRKDQRLVCACGYGFGRFQEATFEGYVANRS